MLNTQLYEMVGAMNPLNMMRILSPFDDVRTILDMCESRELIGIAMNAHIWKCLLVAVFSDGLAFEPFSTAVRDGAVFECDDGFLLSYAFKTDYAWVLVYELSLGGGLVRQKVVYQPF